MNNKKKKLRLKKWVRSFLTITTIYAIGCVGVYILACYMETLN